MEQIATGKLGTGNLLDDISKAYILALQLWMKFWVPEAVKNFEKQHLLTFLSVFALRHKIIFNFLFAFHIMWSIPTWSVLFISLSNRHGVNPEFAFCCSFVVFSLDGMKHPLQCTLSSDESHISVETDHYKDHQGVRIYCWTSHKKMTDWASSNPVINMLNNFDNFVYSSKYNIVLNYGYLSQNLSAVVDLRLNCSNFKAMAIFMFCSFRKSSFRMDDW